MAQELKYINGKWVATEIADTEIVKNEPSIESQRNAEIESIKAQLASTDYKAIKFAEGWLTADEYAPIKAQRQELRNRINELENDTESSNS